MEAVISGFLAALASALGKAAFALRETFVEKCTQYYSNEKQQNFCSWAGLGVCAAAFGCVILLNGAMLSFFLVAMQRSGSAAATVVNSTVNFLSAGLLGWIIFGETLSLQWWLGSLVIILGVSLISSSSSERKVKAK
jgi:drug/metabolite transporter (DMT)-like permease